MGSNMSDTSPSQCFFGSCSYLDLSTCKQIPVQENISNDPLIIDSDGCFSTVLLRSTTPYQHYKMVNSVDLDNEPTALLDLIVKTPTQPQLNST